MMLDWARAKRRALVFRRARRGEASVGAKLNERIVLFLRRQGDRANLHDLARRLGVDRKTLRDARDGKTWSHLPSRRELRDDASSQGARARA